MRINTQAEFRQVEQNGGHFSLDREGHLQTQSAFRHTLQKIADFFRSLTPGGRAAIAARDAHLRAAMDEFTRQGTLPNVAKSDIPRPSVRPEALRQATSRAATSGAEAKAPQTGAKTEASSAPQTDAAQREQQLYNILSEVHDMAEAEIARLLPELDDETRSSFAFSVSERMQSFLQDAELSGNVLREMVTDVVRDITSSVSPEAPKTEAKVDTPKSEAPKSEAEVDAPKSEAPKSEAKVDAPKPEAKTDAPQADAVQSAPSERNAEPEDAVALSVRQMLTDRTSLGGEQLERLVSDISGQIRDVLGDEADPELLRDMAAQLVSAVPVEETAGPSPLSPQVAGMAENFVNTHFRALPQQARNALTQELRQHLERIGLERRVPDEGAKAEVVEFCARSLVYKRRHEMPFASLPPSLYTEPRNMNMPLLELRAFANKLSVTGQMRAESYDMVFAFCRRVFPGSDAQAAAQLYLKLAERMNMDEVRSRTGSDLNLLRREVERVAYECAQGEPFINLLNQKPEEIVSEEALNGMKELTRADIRPDTILQQGANTCFMLSVLNSMMTTERGRALLASHLNDDGTMNLLPGQSPQQTERGSGFSRLEYSLAAAYLQKDHNWRLGTMGVAPEFAALFGMSEVTYREGDSSAMGVIWNAEDADIIRQHLEQGRMVLLYRGYHYRAVVGIEGNLVTLRNSLHEGREEKVVIGDLVGGSVSVMEYPN